MSFRDLLQVEVIVAIAVILLIATIIPGIRLYWPRRGDPVSRSDLGVALMGGALIAFAVLVVQVMIQYRAETDSRQRQEQAERQSLLLLLGRSPNLAGLKLEGEDLREAYLNAKDLRSANLVGAKMNDAQLEDATLVAADLRGATLDGAFLNRADLRYANLTGASLVEARLRGAKLDAASLKQVTDGSEVVRVDLTEADLTNAWVRADLRGAILKGADLVGTRLATANLEGADLTGADLEFVDLRGANLKGADLLGARNITKARDLSGIVWDKATRWPSDLLGEDGKRPKCPKPPCTLKMPAAGVAAELVAVRAKLEEATKRKNCLPGWQVDERKLSLYAHEPQGRATFWIRRSFAGTAGAHEFAEGLDGRPDEVEPIKSRIEVLEARDTYAERFESGDSVVAIYFVRGEFGVSLWGSASAEVFTVFQRDFLKLFRLMGVTGEIFESVPEEKDGCPK